ncbi:MAG: T9SS type A sorting domain-containing protein [Bacteroidia bacterium]
MKLGLMSILVILGSLNCTAQKFCQEMHSKHLSSSAAINDERNDSFDILEYFINADFTSYRTEKDMDAVTVLKIHKKEASDQIELDLIGFNVEYAVINHLDTVSFSQNGDAVYSDVSAVAVGDTFLLEIAYRGNPAKDASWGGFYFNGDYAFNLGVGFAADPHNFGRAWYPCFDNFTDRALYNFNIVVDSGDVALCNGSLIGVIPVIGGETIYSWEMRDPIPTYLVSVAIAPYEMIEYNVDGTPVLLASVASDTSNMKQSFENLPDCIRAFVKQYGEHSFERIGFNMVPFNGGAMEHATNIAYPRFGIAGGSKNYETLFAHELAHHWWGNTVTCRTQEDMWINEGWASFSERVFLEAVYGKEAYKDDIRSNHKAVVHYAHLRDGQTLPVSGIGHANTYGMHVYDKGADMVHTLRGFMGDSAFFKACASFQKDFKFKDVSTEDMRDHFQQFTSISLDKFFEQWIKTAGFAQFYIVSVEQDANAYQIRIKQNQRFNSITYEDVVYDITAFSSDFESVTIQTITDGSDYLMTIDKSEIPFIPVYWALDFNERISDAITDEWAFVKQSDQINFEQALFEGTVTSASDSALFRVEHHWVSPDHYFNKIEGLAMSKERYWTVDGVWPADFKVEGTFEYNGLQPSSAPQNGYLDNQLIRITEDSLVLLYRPNAISDWQIHPDYVKNMGSVFNKLGTVVVSDLKKGQYTFGMYDQSLLTNTSPEPINLEYKLYPNPASTEIHLEFEGEHPCCMVEITNSEGKVVLTKKFKSKKEGLTIDVASLAPGTYFIGLSHDDLAYESRKLIIQ